jgi:hypothetical protein
MALAGIKIFRIIKFYLHGKRNLESSGSYTRRILYIVSSESTDFHAKHIPCDRNSRNMNGDGRNRISSYLGLLEIFNHD